MWTTCGRARAVLLSLLPLLLAGCCDEPDLKASWYVTTQSGVPCDDLGNCLSEAPPPTPAASVPREQVAPLRAARSRVEYQALRRNTRMMVVVVNGGREAIRLHSFAINPGRQDGAEGGTAVVVPRSPIILSSGGLTTLDVTPFAIIEDTVLPPSGGASEAGRLTRCVLPLRLRVTYSDATDNAARDLKDRPQVDILLSRPLPDALPHGWEQCGVLQPPGPDKSAPATSTP